MFFHHVTSDLWKIATKEGQKRFLFSFLESVTIWMKLKSSSCQLSTWNEFAIFFSKIQSSQLSSNLTQRMEPQQASYEFYWLLSTQHPWHRWSIWLCLGWNPLQKLCGKFMTVIVFFHGFICPICLSFPFRLGPGFTFIAPLQAAEDPIVESCRFRGTKRWRFVHTKNLRGNFCKTEEPDPTSDKTSVGRGCFFF